jgi:hypothetical protein
MTEQLAVASSKDRFARAISFSYIAFIVSRSSRKFYESSGWWHLPAGVAGDIVVT